ncbi:MAG: hypothetical protein ACLP7P_16610 [Rhodomicrobium sp.]
MSDFVEFLKVMVPAVFLPLGAFIANWLYRGKFDYNQTAAADFLLAVMLFDASVVATSGEFEPFVKNEQLRSAVIIWHIFLGIIGGLTWLLITRWGEPKLVYYYESRRKRPPRPEFPWYAYIICWSIAFILVVAHVTFFVFGGGHHNG